MIFWSYCKYRAETSSPYSTLTISEMAAGFHRKRSRAFSIIHKYFKQVSLRLFCFWWALLSHTHAHRQELLRTHLDSSPNQWINYTDGFHCFYTCYMQQISKNVQLINGDNTVLEGSDTRMKEAFIFSCNVTDVWLNRCDLYQTSPLI